jgi:excisionase family DNA binding protein
MTVEEERNRPTCKVPFLRDVRQRSGSVGYVIVGDFKVPTSCTLPQAAQDGTASSRNGLYSARLLTRTEAAQFLKVSVNTVDRLRYQRALAYYRLGGSVRFSPWDLLEYMSGKPVFPEQTIQDVRRTLTKAELADFLRVSSRSVEHLVRNRGLWRRRVGRSVRFLLGDVLLQLADEFRVAPHG